MTTETETTFGSDVQGLAQAAQEVTANREAPPPPPEPTMDHGETAVEGPGNLTDKRQPPVSLDKSVSLRDAAEELGDWREKRDQEKARFNAAIHGVEQPEVDFASLSVEEQYRLAKDAMRRAEDGLGITSEADQRRAETEQRWADARAHVAARQHNGLSDLG